MNIKEFIPKLHIEYTIQYSITLLPLILQVKLGLPQASFALTYF